MSFLADIPPLNIGAGGLVVLIVVLILMGKLVPVSTLRDAITQRDKALDLADKYQKVGTEQGMTLHQVLDVVDNINDVVTAIQAAGLHVAANRPPDKGPTE